MQRCKLYPCTPPTNTNFIFLLRKSIASSHSFWFVLATIVYRMYVSYLKGCFRSRWSHICHNEIGTTLTRALLPKFFIPATRFLSLVKFLNNTFATLLIFQPKRKHLVSWNDFVGEIDRKVFFEPENEYLL